MMDLVIVIVVVYKIEEFVKNIVVAFNKTKKIISKKDNKIFNYANINGLVVIVNLIVVKILNVDAFYLIENVIHLIANAELV
jgi:hypothetical protein